MMTKVESSDTGKSIAQETSRKMEAWERHWQTILLGIVTLAISFTGKFMWDVNKQLSEIVIENRHLHLSIARLEGTIAAFQANYVTRVEFAPYQERLTRLEDMRKPGR